MNLHKNESNYSKLLIIGNKRDLVEDADLRRIKNELSIPEFKEISLNDPDAKTEIQSYITEILGLKEKFPENLKNLISTALQLRKHLEINKKDIQNKRNLQLTESKIRRLTKYYHSRNKLPKDWKYSPKQAKLMFE